MEKESGKDAESGNCGVTGGAFSFDRLADF
jgi:hypothetical protein